MSQPIIQTKSNSYNKIYMRTINRTIIRNNTKAIIFVNDSAVTTHVTHIEAITASIKLVR